MNRPPGESVFVPDRSHHAPEALVQGAVVKAIWRPDPNKRRFMSADPILYGYVVELPDGSHDEYELALCKFPPRPVA